MGLFSKELLNGIIDINLPIRMFVNGEFKPVTKISAIKGDIVLTSGIGEQCIKAQELLDVLRGDCCPVVMCEERIEVADFRITDEFVELFDFGGLICFFNPLAQPDFMENRRQMSSSAEPMSIKDIIHVFHKIQKNYLPIVSDDGDKVGADFKICSLQNCIFCSDCDKYISVGEFWGELLNFITKNRGLIDWSEMGIVLGENYGAVNGIVVLNKCVVLSSNKKHGNLG